MNDGSMSAEEYLKRAVALNERRKALDRERNLLANYRKRADADDAINMDMLAELFRQAPQPHETAVIDFCPETPQRFTAPSVNDADITVRGVHRLPVRVQCAHPLCGIYCSATEPMRQQMNSGEYPTLEAHRDRTSVAYEPRIDEMGQFAAKQLTPEEEHAIRTRAHRNPVR